MTKPQWQNYWRVSREAAFGSTVNGDFSWNEVPGIGGWLDFPPMDIDGLNATQVTIFPTGQSGSRGMHNAAPVAGAYEPDLGSLEFPVYPELIDPFLYNLFGQVTRTPTAGVAAQASTAFASLATLTTQPDNTEMLKFSISGSTASSSAQINIIQNSVTVETINIGTSVSSVDGDYYSKGGYDGSTNDITFTVSGAVTGGNVIVSGVDYVTNVFTAITGATVPTLQIEQGGRPEAGAGNSEFFTGVVAPSINLSYDRRAADGVLAAAMPLQGLFPGAGSTKTTFANDAVKYYKPMAGWTGTALINNVAGSCNRIVSMNLDFLSNNTLLSASCGSRQPSEAIPGQFEISGTMIIRPDDETDWNNYVNTAVQGLSFDFVTPYFVDGTIGYQFKIEMSEAYIISYTRSRDGEAQTAELGFQASYNDTDSGPIKITTRSRMPI